MHWTPARQTNRDDSLARDDPGQVHLPLLPGPPHQGGGGGGAGLDVDADVDAMQESAVTQRLLCNMYRNA